MSVLKNVVIVLLVTASKRCLQARETEALQESGTAAIHGHFIPCVLVLAYFCVVLRILLIGAPLVKQDLLLLFCSVRDFFPRVMISNFMPLREVHQINVETVHERCGFDWI